MIQQPLNVIIFDCSQPTRNPRDSLPDSSVANDKNLLDVDMCRQPVDESANHFGHGKIGKHLGLDDPKKHFSPKKGKQVPGTVSQYALQSTIKSPRLKDFTLISSIASAHLQGLFGVHRRNRPKDPPKATDQDVSVGRMPWLLVVLKNGEDVQATSFHIS